MILRAAAYASCLRSALPVLSPYGDDIRPLAVVGYNRRRQRPWIAPGCAWGRVRDLQLSQITSDDDLIAAAAAGRELALFWSKQSTFGTAAAGQWFDGWNLVGDPDTGTYGTASTLQLGTDAIQGAIPLGGDVSPMQRGIAALEGGLYNLCRMVVAYDRVGTYDANPYTNATVNMDNTAGPVARYIGATAPGLQLLLTNQVIPSGAVNITSIKYTDNKSGTTARAVQSTPFAADAAEPDASNPNRGAWVMGLPGSANGPICPWLTLQGTDQGVSKVESYATDTVRTGSFSIAMIKELGMIPFTTAATQFSQCDVTRQIARFERLYDGACVSFVYQAGSGGSTGPMHLTLHTYWG